MSLKSIMPSNINCSNNLSRSPVQIPVLTIQSDWEEALREIGGEAWISCKFKDRQSIQGTLTNNGLSGDGIADISVSEGFSVQAVSKSVIQLTFKATGHSCVLIAPRQVFRGLHNKGIIGLDVTGGGLGVSICTENKLQIWDTDRGLPRRTLTGHVGDVYTCRFFPSGVVVLSGGADMQLKIWSAETGKCPVTLSGHKAAVMDTCIVDRGRNIISVSKDGTARLWDCGESSCLATLVELNATINCCAIGIASNDIDVGTPPSPPSEREIGTENKILLLGCEEGSVHCIGVHSRKKIFSIEILSAVNCVTVLSAEFFIVGCQDGQVALFRLGSPTSPLRNWSESNSPVLSFLPYGDGFFVGRNDGTCSYYYVDIDRRIQLTGSDCDPIYGIAKDTRNLFTACRDGRIRRYKLEDVFPN